MNNTASTGLFLLSSGTLNLNGYTLNTGQFSSSGTNARTINFGSNNIVLAATTAATLVLSMADATNFTWTGTGGFTTIKENLNSYKVTLILFKLYKSDKQRLNKLMFQYLL